MILSTKCIHYAAKSSVVCPDVDIDHATIEVATKPSKFANYERVPCLELLVGEVLRQSAQRGICRFHQFSDERFIPLEGGEAPRQRPLQGHGHHAMESLCAVPTTMTVGDASNVRTGFDHGRHGKLQLDALSASPIELSDRVLMPI